MSWLDERNDKYETLRRRAEFARLYRSGEVQQRAENQARNLLRKPDAARWRQHAADFHLFQRPQGESVNAYLERVMLSRYPRHFARIVTSFIGSILQVEDEKTTAWGPEGSTDGLGDPDEDGTILSGYWSDIDGAGEPWPMMRIDVLDSLITTHGQWYYLDPNRDANGQARLHLLKQEDVLNWRFADGRLVEFLIKEGTVSGGSIKSETEKSTRYLYLNLDGWERYEKTDEGDPRRVDEGEWEYPFWRSPDRRVVAGMSRRLPVGFQRINLTEPVGYNTSLDARYLYNLLSDIRWAMRITSFAKLSPEESLSEQQHEQAADALNQGHNLLTFPARFIGPDADVFEKEYAIYQQEVRDFYVTALQSYEDAAKEVTATEKRQEQQAGRYSFLNVLAAAMDAFENDLLYLIEQVELPESPALWRTHTVKRTHDFSPIDPQVRGEQLAKRYFGKDQPVPIGETGKENAALEIAKIDGIQVDEAEITGEVEAGREAEARRERRRELAAQADERALAREEAINGEAEG